MSVYKLYGSGVTDALATADITSDGVIEAVQWAATGDLDADGESFAAELSFASASGFTANDTKSSISTIRQQNGLLTSGAVATGVNMFMGPLDIPVSQGERLYLHGSGTNLTVTCHVYVRDRAGAIGRRVRQ
jgi:hypothetical protein